MIPKYIVEGLVGFLVNGNLVVCAEKSSSGYRIMVDGYADEYRAACANPCCCESFAGFEKLLDIVGREKIRRIWVRNAGKCEKIKQMDLSELTWRGTLPGISVRET